VFAEIEMDGTFNKMLSQLHPGEFIRIQDGAGQSVAVFDGLVWVTQDGDPRDAFVARGEIFALDRPGLTLIEALTDTRLLVLERELSYGAEDDREFA
jgi:Protein of unknown function (DUF2917)